MKRASLLILVALFGVFNVSRAWASGCMWVTEYTLGPQIETKQAMGRFQCWESYKDTFSCSFRVDEDPSLVLVQYGVGAKNLPPQNYPLPVQIESFQAMQWEACESGDPSPEFEANGTYLRFYFGNIEFWQFEEMPVQ